MQWNRNVYTIFTSRVLIESFGEAYKANLLVEGRYFSRKKMVEMGKSLLPTVK